MSYIYILEHQSGNAVKIGYTENDPIERAKAYVSQYRLKGFRVYGAFRVRNPKQLEKQIHKDLEFYRLSAISGAEELFACSAKGACDAIWGLVGAGEFIKSDSDVIPLPEQDKGLSIPVGVRINKSLLKRLDDARGGMTRPQKIREVIAYALRDVEV